MHVKRVSYLSVHSNAEIIAEMLGILSPFYQLVLTVLYFFEFAVFLNLSLHHPDIQLFLFCTQPVGDSFLELIKVIGKQIWNLFAPA